MAKPQVYDRVDYRYTDDYPADVPEENAYVFAGLFLGWLIERALVSEWFTAEAADAIAAFRLRARTGPQIYMEWDGRLVDDMLNPEGNAFTAGYFNFGRGEYLADFQERVAAGLPTIHHAADTWENYDRLKPRLDERYTAWKANTPGRSWWLFRR
jgi:hypothetical protein